MKKQLYIKFSFLKSYNKSINVQEVGNIKLQEIAEIDFCFIFSATTATVDVSRGTGV